MRASARFFTQLVVDFASAWFVDRIGYRVSVAASQVTAALGLIGLAVLPAHQRQGIGAALMTGMIEFARQTHMERLILTCRQEKIAYYQKFGYVNHGISKSVHGGAVWYDMTLEL